jgi:hypothetical protein
VITEICKNLHSPRCPKWISHIVTLSEQCVIKFEKENQQKYMDKCEHELEIE